MPTVIPTTALGVETGSAGLGSLPFRPSRLDGLRPSQGTRQPQRSEAPVPSPGRGLARIREALDASGSLQLGIVLAAMWWAVVLVASVPYGQPFGSGGDAISYWTASLADPYANAEWNQPAAYVYSPAFLQLIAPLSLLPWPAFVGVWTALLLACVGWLCGPRWFAIGVLVAAMEVYGGNISLLLAVAIVLGFRWPAAWSFVLLTKVTPGIGLLWFALRRQWRQLLIALAATAGVALLSAALLPRPWLEWPSVLLRNAGRPGTWAALPVPLVVRLPAAVALLVWGARRDARWTVPVASMLALPALWYGGLSMLLAVCTLTGREHEGPAGDAETVIPLPGSALVLLVGPAGCGKTTFARRHFAPGEVLSSDVVRRWLTGNEADQSENRAAFAILHRAVAARLAAGRLTVVDATNVEAAARRPLLRLARRYRRPVVAIVFALPEAVVQERNRRRSRSVAREVVARHWRTLAAALERGALESEGVDRVVVVSNPAQVDRIRVVRDPGHPPPVDGRHGAPEGRAAEPDPPG